MGCGERDSRLNGNDDVFGNLSELITALQNVKSLLGDLPVTVDRIRMIDIEIIDDDEGNPESINLY